MTPEQAVAHPNWSMGAKISVDSATMANKGLEMIEAAYLFGLEAGRIDVVVHPESIIHSLVEMIDGSTLAQMGPPDMKTPIACALAWPDRIAWPAPRLDLAALGALTFEAPDETRFPALALARQALEAGGAAPAVFNAANEVARALSLTASWAFSILPQSWPKPWSDWREPTRPPTLRMHAMPLCASTPWRDGRPSGSWPITPRRRDQVCVKRGSRRIPRRL